MKNLTNYIEEKLIINKDFTNAVFQYSEKLNEYLENCKWTQIDIDTYQVDAEDPWKELLNYIFEMDNLAWETRSSNFKPNKNISSEMWLYYPISSTKDKYKAVYGILSYYGTTYIFDNRHGGLKISIEDRPRSYSGNCICYYVPNEFIEIIKSFMK